MSYLEALQYLESFINYEKIPAYPYKESLKLERIHDFLTIIENPQRSLRCIHIAGTKGKGSTCAFVAYILREAGYRVGFYTSPHLSDFRERIRILNSRLKTRKFHDFEGMISEIELTQLVERLKPAIDKYNKISKYGPLTFFEVYTCIAFIYFKEKNSDFVVLETGLGGRLDATNVVDSLVCAITPISYEHTQKLGNTLREIATEKAGIIKTQNSKLKTQNLIVINAPQEEEVIEVIRNKCKEVGVELYEVGRDIMYEKESGGFGIKTRLGEYRDLKIRLLGEHQVVNAAVAVGVVEALRKYDINIGIDSIKRGLYNTVWPGRLEIMAKNPLIVLDGAQNIASAAVLKKAIKENFNYKRLILVLGISSDKDIKGICGQLQDLADEVILTQANSPRAAKPVALAEYFKEKETQLSKNALEALGLAKNKARPEDLILVTGSLFVVGEARELLIEIWGI